MRILALAFLAIVAATPAFGREHRFLRIYHPMDGERYVGSATIAVNGYLYLPGREISADTVDVRVAFYRPVDGRLKLQQAGAAKLFRGADDGPGERTFLLNFDWVQRPPAGQYVVRIDCLDRKDGQAVIATQSVFITILPPVPAGPQEITSRPPIEATRPG
ncbi:MAG TPA: hypothetical protein VF170_17800 [Planctomycetaceae bacterium]